MKFKIDDEVVYLSYEYLKDCIVDYDYDNLAVPFECYIISNMKPGDIAEVDYDIYKYKIIKCKNTIRQEKLKRILD